MENVVDINPKYGKIIWRRPLVIIKNKNPNIKVTWIPLRSSPLSRLYNYSNNILNYSSYTGINQAIIKLKKKKGN